MIRILLIDDHTLFRSGVKALLQRQPDFEVVGEASDGLEGVKLVEQVEADVVLLDLDMPSMNGREALEQIRETHPNLAVLCHHLRGNHAVAVISRAVFERLYLCP